MMPLGQRERSPQVLAHFTGCKASEALSAYPDCLASSFYGPCGCRRIENRGVYVSLRQTASWPSSAPRTSVPGLWLGKRKLRRFQDGGVAAGGPL